jgi:hypothetical protein
MIIVHSYVSLPEGSLQFTMFTTRYHLVHDLQISAPNLSSIVVCEWPAAKVWHEFPDQKTTEE